MTPTKRFLLVFVAVYVAASIAGMRMWGPPGFTEDYLKNFEADHERYLQIIKSKPYQIYLQQGAAAPADTRLADQAAFVNAYRARENFEAESKRQEFYGYYFDFLNIAGLITIAVRFGRRPLLTFLESQTAIVRDRLQNAEQAKKDAGARLREAEARAANFETEEREAEANSEELVARQRAAIEEATAHALEHIDEETADRLRIVHVRAAKRIRRELVEQAIEIVAAQYMAHANPDVERQQIEAFAANLNAGRTNGLLAETVAK
jgi:F0F1-type ATP synthase membrane subunit b/b'